MGDDNDRDSDSYSQVTASPPRAVALLNLVLLACRILVRKLGPLASVSAAQLCLYQHLLETFCCSAPEIFIAAFSAAMLL